MMTLRGPASLMVSYLYYSVPTLSSITFFWGVYHSIKKTIELSSSVRKRKHRKRAAKIVYGDENYVL